MHVAVIGRVEQVPDGDLYRYPRRAVGVRVRATMGPCDVPSLPTRMIGRSEDPAASAEAFGRVVAGRGDRVVVTGESAYAPAAPPSDEIRGPCSTPSVVFGARSIT